MPATDNSMIWNFKLLSHNTLDGFGGIGEGMSMQLTKDGRRILWLAHESAPKNFTAVDVTDPKNPKIVARRDLPQSHMRSNSLETVGDILAVAYQTKEPGLQPAGFELFDISTPENPKTHQLLRLLGPGIARRPPAVVHRRRDHPHERGRARFPPDPSQGRPVLPRDRREEPVEADRDRPLVDAGAAGGRQRGAAQAPPRRHR